jgi:polyisoprenoid-binding protein YceI
MSQQTRRYAFLGIAALAVVGVVVMAFLWFSGGSGQASVPAHAECSQEIIDRSAGATVFRIVPEESEARFIIQEDLFGQPNEVVGRTDQVAGDVLINPANPARAELCAVQINLRTILTDNEFRNRAIRGQILQSAQDEFEFSEFTPTEITGLPETITQGEPVTFQITGNLRVRHIVGRVTFDATATLVSDTRLEGSASTTVTRTQYELTIPSAPGVANVSEEVGLEIDFVALAVPPDASQS